MRAFVSGATGFLGRHLVEALVRHDWVVRALVRQSARAQELPADVVTIRGDIRDERATAEAVRGADVVFHLAATLSGDWQTHHDVTVEGTRTLLGLCRRAGVRRFIFVSSIAIYDKRGCTADREIDEAHPLLPASPAAGSYARAKIEAEALCRAAYGDPMEIVIVRPGLIFGPERLVFPHLGVPIGERLVAIGGPNLRLPLIGVESAVDALLRLATAPGVAGNVYHAVDTSDVSRSQYLQWLSDVGGQPHRCSYLPVGPVAAICRLASTARRLLRLRALPDLSADKILSRAAEVQYDTSRLERDTGWTPSPNVRGRLARYAGLRAGADPVRIERVGLIGAGTIASAHLEALTRMPALRVVGVFDTNIEAARALVGSREIPVFNDAHRFYAEARPQIVHVLTPPHLHAAIAENALEQDSHVLLEKPAVLTAAECETLVRSASTRNLTIGVDENLAWDPLIRRAAACITRGVLGELVHIDVFMGYDLRRTRQALGNRAPSWALQLPGGLLEDLLPHPLSVAQCLAGSALRLVHRRSWSTGRLDEDCPDELRLSCVAGQTTAHVGLSLSAQPDDFVVTIHGSRARLRVDLQNMLFDCVTTGPGPRPVARGYCTLRSGFRILSQTVWNASRVAAGRSWPPGHPAHLIRAHYAALAAGREVPASLSRTRPIIETARILWPAAQVSPAQSQETHALPEHRRGTALPRQRGVVQP